MPGKRDIAKEEAQRDGELLDSWGHQIAAQLSGDDSALLHGSCSGPLGLPVGSLPQLDVPLASRESNVALSLSSGSPLLIFPARILANRGVGKIKSGFFFLCLTIGTWGRYPFATPTPIHQIANWYGDLRHKEVFILLDTGTPQKYALQKQRSHGWLLLLF